MSGVNYHLQRSSQFYELDRFENCYQEATEALKYDAENEEAFFLILLALIQLKKYDQAEQIGNTAIGANPNSDQLFYAMGILYNRKENFGKAKDYLEAAIRIDPTESQYFVQLAKSHLHFNQVKQAQALLNHSLKLNPNNESALQLKSLLEQQTGTNQQAQILADKALNLSPEDAQAHLVKATLFWQNKNYAAAESHLATAVQLQPQNQDILALWLESRTRNIPKWKTPINLVAGNSQGLLRPSLISGGLTFLVNVLLSNQAQFGIVIWIGVILVLIPSFIFWFIRPFLKFRFLNRKFKWAFFEVANPALPIEILGGLNLIASIIFWLSGNGLFFGISFLSTLIGTGMAALKSTDSYFPIFKNPIRTSGIIFGVTIFSALILYFLNELGK
ncbi:MAG: tetratricopeptide repeat protein [Saprospiraceae bacterium]